MSEVTTGLRMPLAAFGLGDLSRHLNEKQIKFEINAEIKKWHWLKMGEGRAEIAILPEKKCQLIELVRLLQENGVNFLIIGNGSNCYFTNDAKIPILIVTTKIREVRYESYGIYADTGVPLATLAKECSSRGYTGFEGLVGVPGTVGAAARNNSGSYFDCEMSKLVQSIEVIDRAGLIRVINNEDLAYSHRSSILKRGDLEATILAVNFYALTGESLLAIKQRIELAQKRRVSELEVRNKNLGAIFVGKEILSALQNSSSWRIKVYDLCIRCGNFMLRRIRCEWKFPATGLFFALFMRPRLIKNVSSRAVNCFVWRGTKLNDRLFFSYICLMRNALNVPMEVEVFDKSVKPINEGDICEMLDSK